MGVCFGFGMAFDLGVGMTTMTLGMGMLLMDENT